MWCGFFWIAKKEDNATLSSTAAVAQSVERTHGKGEVDGSIPFRG